MGYGISGLLNVYAGQGEASFILGLSTCCPRHLLLPGCLPACLLQDTQRLALTSGLPHRALPLLQATRRTSTAALRAGSWPTACGAS